MLERISRVRPFEQGSSQVELREIGEIGEMAISSHQWQITFEQGTSQVELGEDAAD